MLTEKDQELIAIGASIAAGCQPCTTYHFRAARIAGANDDEIRQSVSDALAIRRSATEIMARLGNQPDTETKPETISGESKSLIRELVSISAAYAVNCVTSLETHLAFAQQQNAPDDQILTALKIACAVKNVAGNKIQAAATKAFGGNAEDGSECGCQDYEDLSGEPAQSVRVTQLGGDRTRSCSCQ
jgi:AhpD family alkylhydroperoxidase